MRSLPLLLSLLLPIAAAQAEQPASHVEPWTLPDQFDQPYSFDPDERVILIAASTGAARLVDEAIKNKPEGWLTERSAIYLADITHVPRMVANRVLVPSMRSASYRILLDRDGQVASHYVEDRSKVLWLTLDEGQITDRQRFESAEALRTALESLPVAEVAEPVEPAAQ